MSVFISLHGANKPKIEASSTRTVGAPLEITLVSGDGTSVGAITFYLDDQDYVDRLVAAIKDASPSEPAIIEPPSQPDPAADFPF